MSVATDGDYFAEVTAAATVQRNVTMAVRTINAAIRRLDWAEVENSLQPHGGGEGVPYELCAATLDEWLRYAESEYGALPRSMLIWSNGTIFIVELQGTIHDDTVRIIDFTLGLAAGTGDDHLCGHLGAGIHHVDALGNNAAALAGLRPDASYGPSEQLIQEAIIPQGFDLDEFHTLKVEVGVSQGWGGRRGLNYKADMWRQYPGIQYVLCVRLRQDLTVRQYRLDSIVGGQFELPRMGITAIDAGAILHFGAHRLLGLPPMAALPAGFHDPVILNLIDVVDRIRRRAEAIRNQRGGAGGNGGGGGGVAGGVAGHGMRLRPRDQHGHVQRRVRQRV